MNKFCVLFFCSIVLFSFSYLDEVWGQQKNLNQFLQVKENKFWMEGKPFDLWGIRTASATENEVSTQHLIAQLEDYKSYGVNSIAVYFMGSNGGAYDPFNEEGTDIDRNHLRRMKEIIDAAERMKMVVIVGIFYQNVPREKIRLKDWQACKNAVCTVAQWLKKQKYGNVILNIANEQNSAGHIGKPWEKVRDPEYLLSLCYSIKKITPGLIVGAGGYDIEKNKIIGISDYIDVLLFDTTKPSEPSVFHFEEYKKVGILKPMVNVEMFGAWTGRFKNGVFLTDSEVQHFYHEVDGVAETEGLYTFFFAMDWLQGKANGKTNRYDIAGEGTMDSPGIRWFFRYVKSCLQKNE